MHSRNKGKRGEREFAEVLRNAGFEANRDGRLDDDLKHNVPGVHFEVKRRETLAIPAWFRQAEGDAKGREPIVVYRRNHEPWRAVVNVEFLLKLLGGRCDSQQVTTYRLDGGSLPGSVVNAEALS